ncbi:MAG: hypothetical protein PWK00_02775, partial [Coxiella burnetii]|nr:hypothetical protein [Coxiella burnetii]
IHLELSDPTSPEGHEQKVDGLPQASSDPRMALGACQEIPWPQAQDDVLISQAVIDLGMKK